MAARTGVGIGMGITVTILGVASLALFILSIVFLSKYQASQKSLQQANADLQDFVSPAERQRDDIRGIVEAARSASPRQSAVAYMQSSLSQAIGQVTGAPRDTIDRMREKVAALPDAQGSLIDVVKARDARISRLESDLAAADAARTAAQADLSTEVRRRQQMEQSQQATLAALSQQADRYKAEVDDLRRQVNDLSALTDKKIEEIRNEADQTIAALRSQVNDANTQVQILQGQLDECRQSARGQTLRPEDEFALVDGQVIGLNSVSNQVTINRGRADKVPLGLLLSVYSGAEAIQPDVDGAYPRGKASLEVISVGETSSQCRVIPGSEIKGNPVVKGDVVANPIYDPRKVYKFVVFGNFDADGDRVSTPAERDVIAAMIAEWGGGVIDNLAGDVDFLVLGDRPLLPPKPTPESPLEIIQNYMRLNAQVEQYDRLLQQAQATGVPVLNQNRLYTLIGR